MNDAPPTPLIAYRLFWTNGAGRILSVPEVIEAEDDVRALELARDRVATERKPAEVWLGSRIVAPLMPNAK